jgi:hypothetical protein
MSEQTAYYEQDWWQRLSPLFIIQQQTFYFFIFRNTNLHLHPKGPKSNPMQGFNISLLNMYLFD